MYFCCLFSYPHLVTDNSNIGLQFTNDLHDRVGLDLIYLSFKYIWRNRLSRNNEGCALVETKVSNEDNNTTNWNVCVPCLPTTIFV